ncbi:MAG: hypothetical protein JO254_07960 [Pseudolabrys sp.]|nr:hypothetical protein [Pseudolabrys sp.]
MRKLTLAIAATAFVAGSFALPVTQASAQDKTVIIKKDRGHHYGWRHHHHHDKVVVIKKERHHD